VRPPLKVLLDAGIITHAEFAVSAIKQHVHRCGDRELTIPIHGFVRKPPHQNAHYQAQIDALFTIGRLIRQGCIEAYKYSEIQYEVGRGYMHGPACDALKGCTIESCPPAVERCCFRGGPLVDVVSKGGKKDRKAGVRPSDANQIASFEWLCSLKEEHVKSFLPHLSKLPDITDFDLESLRNIDWFQLLCQRSGSRENYPDVFHLWTAERNDLDAFLTLESRLPNLVSRVKNEKVRRIDIRTEVLRPLELLQKLGIDKPDPVPMEPNRFYYFHELLG
jgi:hypothetical protein